MMESSESAEVFKIPSSTNCDNEDKQSLDTKQVEKEKPQPQKPPKQRSDKNLTVVPLPYKEPDWGCIPPPNYYFEIIKNGTSVSTVDIKSSYFVFGRLQVCDVIFEHPSVSRYHAVLQFCKGDEKRLRGFYLYDLGSTHGTFLNKEQITPHVYYRLKVGYVLKFGGSSRLHIFQGPDDEDEIMQKTKSGGKVDESSGCSWGMGEDADQEEAKGINPFAITTDHELVNFDDPKKTLKAWFEREGYEVEYDVEEKGTRTFMCSVKLPVDTPTGEFLTVEASVTGKKKEAIVACALEACRTLDNMGILRQSQQEAKRRKTKKWEENDFYDSDEDTFYDRTGEIEKRRQMRMRLANKVEVDNYQTLDVKLKTITSEIDDLNKRIDSISGSSNKVDTENTEDSLESYMSSLSESAAADKFEKRKLKLRLIEAEKEKSRLEKMLDIAKPTKLPPLIKKSGIIGKRLKSKLQLPPKQSINTTQSEENEKEFIEEKDSDSDLDLSEKEVEKTECDSSVESKKYGLQFVQKQSFQIKSVTEKLPTSVLAESDSTETKKVLTTLDDITTDDTIDNEKKKTSSEVSIDKPVKKHKSKKQKTDVDVYKTENNEYCTWTPPVNQTGDGTTHLNAKYGY